MVNLLLFLFSTAFSFAYVIEAPVTLIDYQQNPSSLEWQKIDSDHFEIIFPKEIEAKAQKVTHLLETAYPLVSKSLEISPKKISLILQNQSTVSNGFVTLAPRRSEWYVTPSFDPELTNTEWLKTLAIHEFRHVVQFQKSRQGFNRVFEVLLGEIGQALGIGLSMPPWFLEGDAVGMETALSKGGRGRLPLFERDLKALLLSGRDYDYDKAHLGSYENYLPNHYVYGYFYTSFLRNQHGDLFLSQIADRSTAKSYNPLTFYNSYRSLTGSDFEHFYRQTINELIKNWKEKEAQLVLTPFEVRNLHQTQDWTNYLYPQVIEANKFLALKKGLSYINQFVVTDGKKDETVFYPGPLSNEYPYKLRNQKFAFIEEEVDPRWGYRDFSRIRVYDLKEKKIISDLPRTKARLAVLDPTGERILYVEWDESQGQHIMVSNLNGDHILRLQFPVDRVITSLDWFSSDEIIMVVKDQDDQKELVKYNLANQEESVLSPKSTVNLGFVTAVDGHILVEGPGSGIDNIFEAQNGQLIQLTSSRFGAYAPSIYNEELIYNDYSAQGMNIVSKKLPWAEEQKSSDSFFPYYEKFAASETPHALDLEYLKTDKYPVTSYSQVKKAFNLHSWFFLAPPLSSTLTFMGISRDVMNKFSFSFGGNYDLNEKVSDGFVSAAWSHYYPVFDLRAGYGGRNQKLTFHSGKQIEDHWEEGTFEGGVQIPWKKFSGRFTHNFNFRSFGKVIKVTNKYGHAYNEVKDGALLSPGAEAQYSFTSRLAKRDMNPTLGATILAHFEEGKDITGQNQKGSLLTADGRIFVPGFLNHHSFFHQFAFEKQKEHNYQYKSLIMKPRGTQNIFLEESTKYSGNYLFPLFYPDWHASRYAYFKRIAMNLFYDDMKGRTSGFDYYAASTGWEIFLETHFLRIFIPITVGVRGNYVLHGQERNNYEIFVTTLGGTF